MEDSTNRQNIANNSLPTLDLNQAIDQMKRAASWAEKDLMSVTLFKSESMRIVLIGMHENAVLKSHKANGVISVQVLDGVINFVTEQQEAHMEKEQMITLQENIIHSVTALKESFFLLTLAMKHHA